MIMDYFFKMSAPLTLIIKKIKQITTVPIHSNKLELKISRTNQDRVVKVHKIDKSIPTSENKTAHLQ